jgi:endonuclease/exonuclease/phosphatase family metal-dependent hydrolase
MLINSYLLFPIIVLLVTQPVLFAQSDSDLWINEMHYDNIGSDTGEFIEIVVQANFNDLDGIGITLYNGNPAGSLGSYRSYSFSDLNKGDTQGSITVYYLDLPSNGIQNGSPDGLSLDVNGALIQFLSYEGTFTASDGPAQGITSIDIGVEQSGVEPGSSVSLSGTGTSYSDFQWSNNDVNSKGSVNKNQTIKATESNIDDPTIQVFADGVEVALNDVLNFGSTLVDNTKEVLIEYKNLGNDTLVVTGSWTNDTPFSNNNPDDIYLAFNEINQEIIEFSPVHTGNYNGTYTIQSNAENYPNFELSLEGESISSTDYIPITNARKLSEGTIVNIAGIVTVADEFAGPVYFQDETAGIAWFYSPMRNETATFFSNVNRGDSIYITGELGSFNELKQIVGDSPKFEFKPNNNEQVNPILITASQLNSGNFEGQLVSMQVEIDHTGVLQGNTNYDITDATGSGVVQISSFTDIVGSTAAEDTTTIVGVVGNFRGTFQLTPRDLNDIDAEVHVIPGEDVPKDKTFDVVTWNIKWFGSASNNPEDDALQFENVKTVITTIDADVYALQEISNENLFNDLVSDLTDYNGVFADYSQVQNTAYLYKISTIQHRNSRLITTGMSRSDWANGRYPYYFQFNATVNDEVREINMFNIHAKAFSEQTDYNQRFNASEQMKNYLDSNHADDNVIFLGDFNDEISQSTVGNNESPYKNFDDAAEYTIVTKSLEESGYTSFSSSSMIDHIVFTSELSDVYFEGAERVENTNYAGNYLSTTSDHFPVWVRFQWGNDVSNQLVDIDSPREFSLEQNYPNPFNPSTEISYLLSESGWIYLSIYDAIGREVAVLVNEVKSAGHYKVSFEASTLSSGLYIYRLQSQQGVITKKMLLVK